MFIYFSVHVTSQQSSSLLTRKVIYKQVRFILNWIFFLNIAIFINKCTTRYNIQIKYSIYITIYVKVFYYSYDQSHDHNALWKWLLCVRFYLYHAKSLLLYLIQSPFVIQPQVIFVYHNVLLSMPYHVEMLLPKRSSLHFFFIHF